VDDDEMIALPTAVWICAGFTVGVYSSRFFERSGRTFWQAAWGDILFIPILLITIAALLADYLHAYFISDALDLPMNWIIKKSGFGVRYVPPEAKPDFVPIPLPCGFCHAPVSNSDWEQHLRERQNQESRDFESMSRVARLCHGAVADFMEAQRPTEKQRIRAEIASGYLSALSRVPARGSAHSQSKGLI
jgi:hypothetical protein